MLPYTPLHHLLVEGVDRPIVMTSGNLSDEPQCTGNEQAREQLRAIADYLLLHDRDIVNRVRRLGAARHGRAPRCLRRARGYAPAPIPLPPGFERAPSILAFGGELKNTFCLSRTGRRSLSQHQGDLEDAATYERLPAQPRALPRTVRPSAADCSPSTGIPNTCRPSSARDGRARDALPLVEVQHHHAHIAACLAENGVPLDAPPVLGVALDGLGLGDDGTIWGGEFLLADYRSFARLATFKPVAMPGGAQAMREPWRNTYAHLVTAIGWAGSAMDYGALELTSIPCRASRCATARRPCSSTGINSPLASSCGRLFDAVAAAVGVCREHAAYEGQARDGARGARADSGAGHRATMPTHSRIRATPSACSYLEPRPMWRALLGDLMRATPPRGHRRALPQGLGAARSSRWRRDSRERALYEPPIALSGGVFQNRVLLEEVAAPLARAGLARAHAAPGAGQRRRAGRSARPRSRRLASLDQWR